MIIAVLVLAVWNIIILDAIGMVIMRAALPGYLKYSASAVLLVNVALGFGVTGIFFTIIGQFGFLSSYVSWGYLIILSIFVMNSGTESYLRVACGRGVCHIQVLWNNLPLYYKALSLLVILCYSIILLNLFTIFPGWDSLRAYLLIAKSFYETGDINTHVHEIGGYNSAHFHARLPILTICFYQYLYSLQGSQLVGVFLLLIRIIILYSLISTFYKRADSKAVFFSILIIVSWSTFISQIPELNLDIPVAMFVISIFLVGYLIYYDPVVVDDSKKAIVVGLLLGMLLGTKVLGCLYFGFALLWFTYRLGIRGAVVIMLVASIIGGPYMYRTYLLTNNPVWPLFLSVFKNTLGVGSTYGMIATIVGKRDTVGLSLISFLLVFPVKYFVGFSANPFYAIYFPFILFWARKNKVLLMLIGISLLIIGTIFYFIWDSRFALPAILILYVLAGHGAMKIEELFSFGRLINMVLAGLMVAFIVAKTTLISIVLLPNVLGEDDAHFAKRMSITERYQDYLKIILITRRLPSSSSICYVTPPGISAGYYGRYFGGENVSNDSNKECEIIIKRTVPPDPLYGIEPFRITFLKPVY